MAEEDFRDVIKSRILRLTCIFRVGSLSSKGHDYKRKVGMPESEKNGEKEGGRCDHGERVPEPNNTHRL